jgi:hypothetical protein
MNKMRIFGNPQARRPVKENYRSSPKEYRAMIESRRGRCAICGDRASKMSMAPAFAGEGKRVGRNCEEDFNKQKNKVQCCKDRIEGKKATNKCINFVKNHNFN